jgi:hypothetical protein
MDAPSKEQHRMKVLAAAERYRHADENLQSAQSEFNAAEARLTYARTEFNAAADELDSLLAPLDLERALNGVQHNEPPRTGEGKYNAAHPQGTIKERILFFLREHHGVHTHQTIAANLNAKPGTVRWACFELVSSGKIFKPSENQYCVLPQQNEAL